MKVKKPEKITTRIQNEAFRPRFPIFFKTLCFCLQLFVALQSLHHSDIHIDTLRNDAIKIRPFWSGESVQIK